MPAPPFYIASERGGSHAENEDVAVAAPHLADESLLVCVLADGQGGRSGGKEAAQMAAQSVFAHTSTFSASRLKHRFSFGNPWILLLTGADEAVSDAEGEGFTTLIGLAAWKSGVRGASCGDSGVFLCRANGTAEWLTENQRKNPPVGSGAAFPVDFSARTFPGDTLLVMSDGAFRYVGEEKLCAACQNADLSLVAAGLREAQKDCFGAKPNRRTIHKGLR